MARTCSLAGGLPKSWLAIHSIIRQPLPSGWCLREGSLSPMDLALGNGSQLPSLILYSYPAPPLGPSS